MAKRQKHGSEEVMLIPFLDILCSLIGILVLIIVVLMVAQMQRVKGRPVEEVERAVEHQKLLKKKDENEKKFAGLEQILEELKKLEEDKKDKDKKTEDLKELLTMSSEKKEKNKKSSEDLNKKIEALKQEIQGFTSEEPNLKKRVEELLAAIDKLKPPENKDPKVVVNPGGSGLGAGTQVFFVDARGENLVYFWNENERYSVAAIPEVIVNDETFNAFLDNVKNVPQSKVIFLVRGDGMRSYNLGAGWAQSKHGYKVEQIGKLPVPGSGDLDMKLFGKLSGTVPKKAPEGAVPYDGKSAKPPGAPAPGAAPAPGTPPPAAAAPGAPVPPAPAPNPPKPQ
jgi:Skp family chaperone for outer membrane proteins